MTKTTVKVRGRAGTATKDLSIPAAVTREWDIEQGDVFALDVEEDEDERLILEYTRVYHGE